MSMDSAVSPAESSSTHSHDEDERADSLDSSPCSSTSPLTPDDSPSPSEALGPEKDSNAGPIRTRSSSAASSKESDTKEKRKRSRVTPEQLAHLERYFSMDRSPTAGRRKEISETLGMQERQTQIWFQNRRAKAKLQDGKKGGRNGIADVPPDMPPELAAGFDVSLQTMIHECEPVTIIPCTDLSIGTWKRIATTVSRHDLVAYVCEAKHCLTWFIHSAGYGFKMEIPFDSIVETKFVNAAPGTGLASFFLSHPPIFFLETITPSSSSGAPVRGWKPCSDWTEGMQATKVLRHDLVGSAVQLAHVLRNLNVNSSTGAEISLHPPSYRPAADVSPTPTQASILGFVESPHDLIHPSRSETYGYDLQRPHSGDSLQHPLTHSPRSPDEGLIPHSTSPSLVASGAGYARMSPHPPRNFSLYPDYAEPPKAHSYRVQELDVPGRDANSFPMTHSTPLTRRSSYGEGPPSSSHSSYSSPSPHIVHTPFHSSSSDYWGSQHATNHTSPMLSGSLPSSSLLSDSQGSGMGYSQPVAHHYSKLP
ncbi:hypothetical protein EIP91_006249 [Steccherinum ochraceum]|uniref:Homeobox domain-containing protein n=1 Tax=Steccherinum ochraceum TaxID=92696 RepID=A0A4R0R682_9APHY|nr:hypothetical protein EIP91_006249 [Steccherinum ochraceum]